MLFLRFPKIIHFRIRIFEWALSVIMLLWATILLNEPDIFKHQQSLAYFATLNPDTGFWAMVCYAIGGVRLMALWRNGAWTPSPMIRIFTSVLSMLFWLWVSVGLLGADYLSTGLAVYPVLCVTDFISMWNAANDARLSKQARLQKPEAPKVVTASA
jgi:hypothetical protein